MYYSPKTGYRSPDHLWELAKEEDPNISKHFVKQWLWRQSSYTRFKKWNNPKHYRHTFVRDFDQLQMDLIIIGKYKDENEGYENILVAIEILSRYAFAIPLKSKTGKETKEGVEKILEEFFERFGHKPNYVQFDEGKEFLNKDVKPVFENLEIKYFSSFSPRKAAVVERFNRTLKTMMMRMFEANQNHIWEDSLDEMIENYNNSFHRSIGMKPKEVNEENKFTVWERLFGKLMTLKKPKFRVGNRVRVTHLNTRYRVAQLATGQHHKEVKDPEKRKFGDVFREEYKEKDEEVVLKITHLIKAQRPLFSVEIFKIDKVLLGDPNVYKLISEEEKNAIEIPGIFYEEELSLVHLTR